MSDIVCESNAQKYYSDNPELIEKYREIARNGECPFCPENIIKEFRTVRKIGFWNIVSNQYPYKNSALHLLIVPERHIISLAELACGEWLQMEAVMVALIKDYPILSKGFSLAVREKEVGGVTLFHIHWHLIVPKVDSDGEPT